MAEMAVELDRVEVDDLEQRPRVSRRLRVWSSLWPKLVAIALALGLWQVVVWAGWQPDYVLPGPGAVFKRLAQDLGTANFDLGVAVTLRRALFGYAIAVAIGSLIVILVARIAVLRKAIGAAILGLQSMPSIAWFPLAILLFGLNETAIFFVVILGAAPAIPGGLLSGVDHVPPLLARVGRVMASRGRGRCTELLDGDEVRTHRSKGLGFSKEDRDTNIRRIGYVARLVARTGGVAITAAISPYREVRDEVRARTPDFVEVYMRCPIETLAERDVKGLYRKALGGGIAHFTGWSR